MFLDKFPILFKMHDSLLFENNTPFLELLQLYLIRKTDGIFRYIFQLIKKILRKTKNLTKKWSDVQFLYGNNSIDTSVRTQLLNGKNTEHYTKTVLLVIALRPLTCHYYQLAFLKLKIKCCHKKMMRPKRIGITALVRWLRLSGTNQHVPACSQALYIAPVHVSLL